MRVYSEVAFGGTTSDVWVLLARRAFESSITPIEGDPVDEFRTFSTRHKRMLWAIWVSTTEETTTEPQRSISVRHTGGIYKGSMERYSIEISRGGRTALRWEADIEVRNPILRALSPLPARALKNAVTQELWEWRRSLEGSGMPPPPGFPLI